MSQSFSWRCPFCGQVATIRADDVCQGEAVLDIKNSVGRVMLRYRFVVCPNNACNRFTLDIHLWICELKPSGGGWRDMPVGEVPLTSWKLIPQSDAKVLPAYVAKAIVDDYKEACAIRTLSPKASATLARRCLQGMIRDFWGIRKSRLIEEIEALEDEVDGDTWKAIDAVRGIGNIGAHMEKDIDTIIEVDPEEAGILIRLIETLIDDWYVARHERQDRLKKVIALGKAKAEKKKPSAPQA
ncbi:MAG TPA: DUF4145 domain-containing protein [Phycisphaerae bacterium]|nr:DUF4145 domain-containing protein [Phycisphaerae bacterium]